jgi:hypothetical protein
MELEDRSPQKYKTHELMAVWESIARIAWEASELPEPTGGKLDQPKKGCRAVLTLANGKTYLYTVTQVGKFHDGKRAAMLKALNNGKAYEAVLDSELGTERWRVRNRNDATDVLTFEEQPHE